MMSGWLPNPCHDVWVVTKPMSWWADGYQTNVMMSAWLPNPCHDECVVTKPMPRWVCGCQTHATMSVWLPNTCHDEWQVTKLLSWWVCGCQTHAMMSVWLPNPCHEECMFAKTHVMLITIVNLQFYHDTCTLRSKHLRQWNNSICWPQNLSCRTFLIQSNVTYFHCTLTSLLSVVAKQVKMFPDTNHVIQTWCGKTGICGRKMIQFMPANHSNTNYVITLLIHSDNTRFQNVFVMFRRRRCFHGINAMIFNAANFRRHSQWKCVLQT